MKPRASAGAYSSGDLGAFSERFIIVNLIENMTIIYNIRFLITFFLIT